MGGDHDQGDGGTESYREEQGRRGSDPRERMARVPITFGGDGAGGIVGRGPEPDDERPIPDHEAAANQRAVIEGATRLEGEGEPGEGPR